MQPVVNAVCEIQTAYHDASVSAVCPIAGETCVYVGRQTVTGEFVPQAHAVEVCVAYRSREVKHVVIRRQVDCPVCGKCDVFVQNLDLSFIAVAIHGHIGCYVGVYMFFECEIAHIQVNVAFFVTSVGGHVECDTEVAVAEIMMSGNGRHVEVLSVDGSFYA